MKVFLTVIHLLDIHCFPVHNIVHSKELSNRVQNRSKLSTLPRSVPENKSVVR